jgi:cytoskeletal protein RodZ
MKFQSMNDTPGKLLKKTRESQSITLQEASKETKIISRYLQALENDNFSLFPGETYTLGFLKSYAAYLKIDPEEILQLYRGAQLVESETPLEELTSPTITFSDHFWRWLKYASLPLLAILIGSGYYFRDYFQKDMGTGSKQTENQQINIENSLQSSENVPSEKTDHITLADGYRTAVIANGSGIDFSVQNTEIYIILSQINQAEKLTDNPSSATFEFYPGKKKLTLNENQTITLDELDLPKGIKFSLMSTTPNNAKIQLELEQEPGVIENVSEQPNDPIRIANPDNFIIRLEAITTGENYVEFFIDGKPGKKGRLAPQSRIYYEANESIQMKIGDAGAIRITINEKNYNFGNRGETVNKVIRKIKDPIEQTRYSVAVKDA